MRNSYRNLKPKNIFVNVFWRIFPFFATALMVGFQWLTVENPDSSFWYIYIPIVTIISLPFFIGVSLSALTVYRRKQLDSLGASKLLDPQLRKYESKSSLWAKIIILTWITVFLIGFIITIIGIKIQRGEWSIAEFNQPANISTDSTKFAVLNILDIIIHYLFFVPPIALAFIAIYIARSFIKKKNQKKPIGNTFLLFGISGFIIPIGLIFLLGWSMKTLVRKEVKSFLIQAPPNAIVKIDGKQIQNSYDVIRVLSKVAPLPAHHSHEVSRVRFDIDCNNNSLTLEVGRDSQYSNEYWIYYPSFRNLKQNEIGKIRTNLFDDLVK